MAKRIDPATKKNLKTLTQTKRRRGVAMKRKIRYGMKSFRRNAWLSVAATAVMIIALLIVGITAIADRILLDTVADVRDKMSYSLYLKTDTTPQVVGVVTGKLLEIENVARVDTTSPEEAYEEFRAGNAQLDEVFEELGELNRFPWILNLRLIDYLDISALERLIRTDRIVAEAVDPENPPSFSDQQSVARDTITEIESMARTVERAGLIGGIAFVVIAILIVFNTIRMAIFHRKDEIYMMKLIGADRGFIRGPFIVEAVLYGLIAGLVSFGILAAILSNVRGLGAYGLAVDATYRLFEQYWWLMILALLLIGVLIGIISSLLATRRYLKLHVKN